MTDNTTSMPTPAFCLNWRGWGYTVSTKPVTDETDCYTADQLRAAVADAVQIERERCAKLCDEAARSYHGRGMEMAYAASEWIAAAIRATLVEVAHDNHPVQGQPYRTPAQAATSAGGAGTSDTGKRAGGAAGGAIAEIA